MARDPQGALIALNRFGFGARGGASGDIVNAASDPRGYVKAELARPQAAMLELPGLQSTPELAQAMFAYQFEVRTAREAAAKAVPVEPEKKPEAPAMAGNTTMTVQPDAPKPPPAAAMPQNVVQKT